MNRLKGEMIPLVKKTLKKGQEWFFQIVNMVDHEVSKTLHLMKEKQEALKEYIIDRQELLSHIEQTQQEVDRLKEKIQQVAFTGESKELNQLRVEMDEKMSELLRFQNDYIELEKKITNERRKIEELSFEKERIQNDRNLLKSEYDHMKILIEESYSKTSELEAELLSLQKQFETSKSNAELQQLKQEYNRKQIEKELLEKESTALKSRFKEIEKDLLAKVSEIGRLNQIVQQMSSVLEANVKEKEHVSELLRKTEDTFKKAREESIRLEKEMEMIKEEANTYRQEYFRSIEKLEKSKGLLIKSEESFLEKMEKFERKEKDLEEELLQRQNELAIEKAKNGEAFKLSETELRVLEREFEPRFAVLYKQSNFYSEFLSDFFHLTPSDRLKVEAVIVQLNYHYDQAISNIRPHSVKTSQRSILEYPFGQDRTGRIYFNKEKNIVQLYRISRTKNGRGSLSQDNVIEWLKKNR